MPLRTARCTRLFVNMATSRPTMQSTRRSHQSLTRTTEGTRWLPIMCSTGQSSAYRTSLLNITATLVTITATLVTNSFNRMESAVPVSAELFPQHYTDSVSKPPLDLCHCCLPLAKQPAILHMISILLYNLLHLVRYAF